MPAWSPRLPAWLVLILVACAGTPDTPVIEPDITALLETAAGNEAKAESELDGKIIRIVGLVQHVGLVSKEYEVERRNVWTGQLETHHEVVDYQRLKLTAPDGAWTSYCFFLKRADNGVAELVVGQQIRARCTFNGFRRADGKLALMLASCELDEQSAEPTNEPSPPT